MVSKSATELRMNSDLVCACVTVDAGRTLNSFVSRAFGIIGARSASRFGLISASRIYISFHGAAVILCVFNVVDCIIILHIMSSPVSVIGY